MTERPISAVIERVTAPYWRIRWALCDRREHRTAREIARLMERCSVLYVHEHKGDAPKWMVHRIGGPIDDTNHDHIEGARRC